MTDKKKPYVSPKAEFFTKSRDKPLLSDDVFLSEEISDSLHERNAVLHSTPGCPHCSSVYLSLLVCTSPIHATLVCDACGKGFEVNGGRLSELSVSELLMLWREALEG